MGSQVLIHKPNEELNTTNLGLKSIAYNNRKEMTELVNAINRNTEYNSLCTQYTNQLTIITNNLIQAANILMQCQRQLANSIRKGSQFTQIRQKWGYSQ